MFAGSMNLSLHLFGPMLVKHGTRELPLPASRKTRAILGFLALSPRPVTRQRLCELFFDLPDDPRASLRWSLTKLRPLIDHDNGARLVSERDSVRLDCTGMHIDALKIQGFAATVHPDDWNSVACLELLDLMSGELLEDCELPERPEYSAWLAAQRQDFRITALRMANWLVDASDGEDRIMHLRRLLALDPVDEPVAASLVEALLHSGRRNDAETLVATTNRQRKAAGLADDPALQRLLRQKFFNEKPEQIFSRAPSSPPQVASDDGRISVAILPLIDHTRGTIPSDLFESLPESVSHMISRFRDVRVCSPAASKYFGGSIADPSQVGFALGVDHLVVGTVLERNGEIKVRYTIIATADGGLLYSNEVICNNEERIRAMLDEIPSLLAVQITRTLVDLARTKAVKTPEGERNAWDHFHAGVVLGLAATPANYQLALDCFDKAISLDDRFARAIGAAAWAKACLGHRENPEQRLEALTQAHRAIALGGEDADTLAVGAWAAVHVALDFDSALRAVDLAVRVNPLSRIAWSTSGWVRAMAGESEVPLQHFDRAEQCNPDDAHLDNVDGGRAFCFWLAGNYDEATVYADRSLQRLPGHVGGHATAIASAISAGRLEQAMKAARRFLAVFPKGVHTPSLQSIPIRSDTHKQALVMAIDEACQLVASDMSGLDSAQIETIDEVQKGRASPLIAILPFVDQSLEPLPGHILDGFVEGVIHAMSRFRSLDVIAGASTSPMRGQSEDPVQTAERLKADILLLGSIARARDGRLRLRWRAVDGVSGQVITFGDLEGSLDDVWEFQETAASTIAVEVEPRAQAEAHRVRLQRPTSSFAAYDLYLQGLFTGFSLEQQDFRAALELFEKAIAIDPDFHPALAMAPWAAAYANLIRGPADLQRYADMSRAALRLGAGDARTQATAGTALFYMAKDYAAARNAIQRAIRLNPNEYTAWICGGWMHAMRAEACEAHEMFDRAERLNPLAYGASGLMSGRAIADFMIGDMEKAETHISLALATDDGHPSALMTGVATAAKLGLKVELEQRRSRFLAIYPKGLGDFVIQALPFEDPVCRVRYFDAVRLGGVPG